jgi:hypothetical protein
MLDYTALIKKIAPEKDGEPPVHLRVGTVSVVNGDGTLDIIMSSGVIVPDVPQLAGAYSPPGAVVQMLSARGSLLVLGAVSEELPAPNQRIATTVVTANSSTFTTTAFQVASVTAPLVAGLVYRVVFDGAFDTTVDGDLVRARIYENSTAGTQLQVRDTGEMHTTGLVTGLRLEVEFTAVTTGNKTFVATGEREAGTGNIILSAHGTFPTYMYVDYVRNSA